jgi:hypothetical protein
VLAEADAQVEVVIVDYGEQEPIFVHELTKASIVVPVYRGRKHYHMAHARNLSIRAASGDYIIITSADIFPRSGFFTAVRARLAETGATWLYPRAPRNPLAAAFVGVIICRRDALIEAGGYDERFEFYGGEDKDLQARLRRRELYGADYDADAILDMFRTTNAEKVANYRLALTKTEMMERGAAIYADNVAARALVANAGVTWGV